MKQKRRRNISTRLYTTWSSCRCPCSLQGSWIRWPNQPLVGRVPPNSKFYDSRQWPSTPTLNCVTRMHLSVLPGPSVSLLCNKPSCQAESDWSFANSFAWPTHSSVAVRRPSDSGPFEAALARRVLPVLPKPWFTHFGGWQTLFEIQARVFLLPSWWLRVSHSDAFSPQHPLFHYKMSRKAIGFLFLSAQAMIYCEPLEIGKWSNSPFQKALTLPLCTHTGLLCEGCS